VKENTERSQAGEIRRVDVPSDLEYKLLKFGLTPLQSKIYLWLIFSGPANASNIIRDLNIHRADVYRVLRSLASKGVIEINMANPTIYSAISISKSLGILLRDEERKFSDLRTLSGELVESINDRISSLSKSNLSNPFGRIFHSSFRLKFGVQVVEMWKEMLNDANEEVMRVWSKFGITYHSEEGLMEEYARCARRGVKIRAITDIDEQSADLVTKYSEFVEFRHKIIEISSLRYTVIDRKEVFVSTTSAPKRTNDFAALWTDNAALVRGFIMDFEEMWGKSRPLSVRLSEIRKQLKEKATRSTNR
jgi:sugar-specific transcriptional regulator TrmB